MWGRSKFPLCKTVAKSVTPPPPRRSTTFQHMHIKLKSEFHPCNRESQPSLNFDDYLGDSMWIFYFSGILTRVMKGVPFPVWSYPTTIK